VAQKINYTSTITVLSFNHFSLFYIDRTIWKSNVTISSIGCAPHTESIGPGIEECEMTGI